MKLWQGILIALLLTTTLAAHAGEPQAQADLLLARIGTALDNDRTSEALSACTKLEKLGPSLAEPLPERFYFYYIETLQRSGAKALALRRAYAYQQQFGAAGAHYPQIAAIVETLEKETMAPGSDADGALAALRREREQEHAQTLELLRTCRDEAIALEGTEQELRAASATIDAQSKALAAARAALERRMTKIERSREGTPEAQQQLRLDFNRDSQAYNDAASAFNAAREALDAKGEGQSLRLERYKERCAELSVAKADLEAVCGESADWFCRGSE